MTGLELLRKLHADGHRLPAIMITGESDVAIAVEAMRAGATDFIEKADRPRGTDREPRSGARTFTGLEQGAGVGKSAATHSAGSGTAPGAGDGDGSRRPPQQEHRYGPRHQPTNRGKPSHEDHEANRIEVLASAGAVGADRGRRRREAAERDQVSVWRRCEGASRMPCRPCWPTSRRSVIGASPIGFAHQVDRRSADIFI